ncbi:hypothetical protein BC826DRAFT_1063995, partial [Russula brevipes]
TRKAATAAERRPENTRNLFASSFQPSATSLSYSPASFIYVDHVEFTKSSRASLVGKPPGQWEGGNNALR